MTESKMATSCLCVSKAQPTTAMSWLRSSMASDDQRIWCASQGTLSCNRIPTIPNTARSSWIGTSAYRGWLRAF